MFTTLCLLVSAWLAPTANPVEARLDALVAASRPKKPKLPKLPKPKLPKPPKR